MLRKRVNHMDELSKKAKEINEAKKLEAKKQEAKKQNELLKLSENGLIGASKMDLILEITKELNREVKRTDIIENEVTLLKYAMEKEIWLTTDNLRTLQKSVASRVRELTDGVDDKSLRRKYFSAIWGAVKDRFRVHSYHVIPRKLFNDSILFVREWYPLYEIS